MLTWSWPLPQVTQCYGLEPTALSSLPLHALVSLSQECSDVGLGQNKKYFWKRHLSFLLCLTYFYTCHSNTFNINKCKYYHIIRIQHHSLMQYISVKLLGQYWHYCRFMWTVIYGFTHAFKDLWVEMWAQVHLEWGSPSIPSLGGISRGRDEDSSPARLLCPLLNVGILKDAKFERQIKRISDILKKCTSSV